MLCWVVEHSGTDASLEVGALQDVIVDAGLAAAPESRIVGQLLEGHRTIAELIVDLEDGST